MYEVLNSPQTVICDLMSSKNTQWLFTATRYLNPHKSIFGYAFLKFLTVYDKNKWHRV